MAAFDLKAFVSFPDFNQLDKCKKIELHDIANYYEISVSTSLGRAELKAVVLNGLISKGVMALPVPLSDFDPELSVRGDQLALGTPTGQQRIQTARMYNSNQRLMRWALLAQGYNLHIKHKRGADNILADALSRGCLEVDADNPAAEADHGNQRGV
ncbi:hypothetical protein R3I93_008420 [Phoxinus phoxinus]|uniref:Uncharacterized protein n=1 Tax=Phoxinus phoxinus TaxID=58324 RepID=A0AAN9H991_9TELE